jgi:hypothetical protein
MAVAQQRRATTASLPAPIGGWNARDSLAAMSPLDAVQLVNFFPTPTDVTLRSGYTQVSLLTTSTGVVTVSSITRGGVNNLTATLVTATAHGLTTGKQVSITGCTPSQFNGVYAITVINATTFTYLMTAVPSGNATVVGTYTIGITNYVESLLNFSGPSNSKLFGAAGSAIYDVTTATATSVLTGLGNAQFQYTNASTAGGNFLIACNGADPVIQYNGSVWYKIATTTTAASISTLVNTSGNTATAVTSTAHNLATGNKIVVSGATPSGYNGEYVITVTNSTTFTYTLATTGLANASPVGTYTVAGITGINSNLFVDVNLFKERIYFVEKNSLSFWYLPVDTISGAATEFPLGGIFKRGGYLQAMGTWTIDAGYGVDDLAAFVTSNGEVAVYKGSDPSDPTDWALVGIWNIGQTFNRKCFFKYGGDLLVLTEGGLVPLSAGLQSTRLDPRVNITDKIFYAISQATDFYSNNFGWQMNLLAKHNMLILNVPVTEGSEQYVMHTITKSWGRFTNVDAKCWELSSDDMFFGGEGYVARFYDNLSDNGTNIEATAQQAFNYFDSQGQLKRFTMVRPILQTANGNPSVLCGISVDFDTVSQLGAVTFNPTAVIVGDWDGSLWDEEQWGGNLVINKIWQSVNGLGYAGSVNINVASQGIELHWASTDYVMERGGVL